MGQIETLPKFAFHRRQRDPPVFHAVSRLFVSMPVVMVVAFVMMPMPLVAVMPCGSRSGSSGGRDGLPAHERGQR